MKWRNASPSNPAIDLVRPLLDQPKAVLREYAATEKIPFREDASNASVEIQRNRIRHELLPLLRRHYQPALDKTILRVMEIAGAEADFVAKASLSWLEEIRNPKSEIRKRPEIRNPKRDHQARERAASGLKGRTRTTHHAPRITSYPTTLFSDLPVAVQRRCVQTQLLGLGIAPDFDLIEQLRIKADQPVSVGISRSADSAVPANCLPETDGKPVPQAVVRDCSGILRLTHSRQPGFQPASLELVLDCRAGEVLFAGATIQWKILPGGSRPAMHRLGCEFFDADRVGERVLLRHWQPGDRFQPIGMSAPVKLQDLFTNQKILRNRRHELILAATASGEVFWVEGLRISERFKLTQRSDRRLRWQWARC